LVGREGEGEGERGRGGERERGREGEGERGRELGCGMSGFGESGLAK